MNYVRSVSLSRGTDMVQQTFYFLSWDSALLVQDSFPCFILVLVVKAALGCPGAQIEDVKRNPKPIPSWE